MTHAVARLEAPGGEVLGTAFAVAPDRALTAFHCLGDRDEGRLDHADAVLRLPGGARVRARFTGGRPAADYAVLALDEALPPGFAPIPLGRRVAPLAPARAIGAIASVTELEMTAVTALVAEPEGRLGDVSVLQLNVEQAARLPLKGLSGGPVLAGEPEQAVGIVRWNPPREEAPSLARGEIVVACPLATVVADIPELTPRLAARRAVCEDLDTRLRRHPLFAGREADLDRLDGFLRDSAAGYLLVTGRSGSGKSTLLAHWARRLAGRAARHDVVFTAINRLQGVADQGNVLRDVAAQLVTTGIARHPPAGSVAQLQAWLLRALSEPAEDGLVVVIDGLDEALDWIGHGLSLPLQPASGVNVVLAARDLPGLAWPEVLSLRDESVTPLALGTLGHVAVRELLVQAGGAAAERARDAAFVELLADRTGGDPLHLRYVVEDVRDGRLESTADLARHPRGLEAYLDAWWRELVDSADAAVRDLLGYLVVALGPIRGKELIVVSGDDALDGFSFDTARDQVWRHLVGDEEGGLALAHPRFRAHIAERFGEEGLEPYRTRLLAHCARWHSSSSRYALRYYARHLAEAHAVEALAALATDEQFAELQFAELPGEPDLGARTTRLAVGAAAEHGTSALLARLLLAHARRLSDAGSALDALRRHSPEAAWALADLQPPPDAAFTHLLLAWELAEAGRRDRALATLQRARAVPLPAHTAVPALAALLAAQPDAAHAVRDFVDASSAEELGSRLVRSGVASAAVVAASWIEDPRRREDALAAAAAALAVAGRPREGLDLVAGLPSWAREQVAAVAVPILVGSGDVASASSVAAGLAAEGRPIAQLRLGEALAEAGDPDAADAAAAAFDATAYHHVAIVIAAAAARIQKGERPEAEARLRSVLATLRRTRSVWQLTELARGAARLELTELATEAVRSARAAALSTRDQQALREVVTAQVEIDDLDGARATAAASEHWMDRGEVLARLVSEHAAAGRVDDAKRLAEEIEDPYTRLATLPALASAGAAGDDLVAEARRCVAAVDDYREQDAHRRLAALFDALGRPDEAVAAVRSLPSPAAATALRELVSARLRRGELSNALSAAEAIPSDDERHDALRDLATARAGAGDLAGALELGARIPPGRWWGLVDTIAREAALRGDEAVLARLLQDGDHGRVAATAAATAFVEAGETDRALALAPAGLSVVMVADALVARGRTVEARNLLAGLRLTTIPAGGDAAAVAALADIAVIQARAGDVTGAWATAASIPDDSARWKAVDGIAEEQARAGDLDGAAASLRDAPIEIAASGRTALAVALAAAGRVDEAVEAVEGLKERALQRALRDIARACGEAADADGAGYAAALLDGEDAAALASIGLGLARAGDAEGAAAEFDRAVTVAAAGTGAAWALSDVAALQARSGAADAAASTLYQAAELAGNEPDVNSPLRVIAVRTAAESGLLDAAYAIATDTADPWSRAAALAEVAAGQAERGIAAAAGTFAAAAAAIEETERRQRDFLYAYLAERLAHTGFLEEAVRTVERVLDERHEALTKVARELAARGAERELLALLPDIAASPQGALEACVVLASLRPHDAPAIAAAVAGP